MQVSPGTDLTGERLDLGPGQWLGSKSPDNILMCTLFLGTSCVEKIPDTTGCSLPVRPVAWTFKKFSFQLLAAFSRHFLFVCVFTLDLINNLHFI